MVSRQLGFGFLLLATVALAAPQKYYFTRKYVTGHVEHYTVTMNMATPMAMTMSMKMTQSVTKAYPNGEADIKVKNGGMAMSMNGQTMPAPTQRGDQKQEMTMRVDKYGNPVKGGNSTGMPMGMDMGLSAVTIGLKKGLIMGQAVPFNVGAGGISGVMKLVAVKDGIARIDETINLPMGAGGMKMTGSGRVYIRVKDGEMLRTEVTMEVPATSPQMGAGQMHLVMKLD